MKQVIISVLIAGLLIVGAVFWAGKSANQPSAPAESVLDVEGRQVIEINAKGGYSPKLTNAKAGVPSVIRVVTKGTFDCSSALVIPAVNYRGYLPPTGTTDIEIPAQTAGTTLRGLCAMGMYSFEIGFN